jgi:hypothetical protein
MLGLGLAEALQEQCPPLRVAAKLAHEFVKLRRVDDREYWLRRACDDGVPAEIRNFAQGLRAELPSIEGDAWWKSALKTGSSAHLVIGPEDREHIAAMSNSM